MNHTCSFYKIYLSKRKDIYFQMQDHSPISRNVTALKNRWGTEDERQIPTRDNVKFLLCILNWSRCRACISSVLLAYNMILWCKSNFWTISNDAMCWIWMKIPHPEWQILSSNNFVMTKCGVNISACHRRNAFARKYFSLKFRENLTLCTYNIS